MENKFLLSIVTGVVVGVLANYIFQQSSHIEGVVALIMIDIVLHLYQMYKEHK
ncbi:hypothetical protein [Lutispora sp.]|uniref:hypothetical protein n=1 Tax=Lutispora sp. TaxID=2828727 RepID=UPI002B21F99A|nr:hypothetical protein [Lutispora sp.]MEA4963595.1 hypothetical protein [Lutispora sp.]